MPLILDGTLGVSGVDGTAAAPSIQGTDSNTGVFYATDIVGIATNGTERMRIDSSGNMSIATGNLTFGGTGQRITGDFSNATLSNRVAFQTSTTNGNTTVGLLPNGTATAAAVHVYGASDPTNTSRMDLVNAGTDVRLASSITGTGTYIPMTFITGGSERLRIDTSGNVGIGTSSPTAPLDVQANVNAVGYKLRGRASDNYSLIEFVNNANNAAYGYIGFPSANNLAFFTNGLNERMRISSAGLVSIGMTGGSGVLNINNATVPNFRLHVNGTLTTDFYASGSDTTLNTVTNGYLAFGTNNTERMRITSSGNVLVGTTSDAALDRVHISQTVSARWGSRYSVNDQGSVTVFSAAGGGIAHYFVTGSTYVGQITCSASATSYLSASDYRLKEDVKPITNALSDVLKLKPVTFTFKNSSEKSIGFIAHELQDVVPQAVHGEKDAIDANGNPKYQGVDTSFLVATLTAAIQEQQAMIEELKQEVALLKAK